MDKCKYCGAEMFPQARFCGNCGRAPDRLAAGGLTNVAAVPTEESEAVMPFPVMQGYPSTGMTPMVQGVPQMGSAAMVQGTPQAAVPSSIPTINPPQSIPSHIQNAPMQGAPAHMQNPPVQNYPQHVQAPQMQGHPGQAQVPQAHMQNYPPQAQAPHMQNPHVQAPHLSNAPLSHLGKVVSKPRIPGLRTATSKIAAGVTATTVVVAVVIVAVLHRNPAAVPGAGAGGAAFVLYGNQGITAQRLDGSSAWTFKKGTDSFGQPVTSNGTVYTIDKGPTSQGGEPQKTNDLYALKASDGSTLWSSHLDDQAGQPIIRNGVVYMNVGKYVYALKASDGAMLWKAPTNGGYQHPLEAVTDTAVYTLGDAYHGLDCLYALNSHDGTLLWRYAVNPISKVLYDKGTIYMVDALGVGSGGGTGDTGEPTSICTADTTINHTVPNLYALNANTGTILWTMPLSLTYGGADMTVSNGTVYVATVVSSVAYRPGSTYVYGIQASNGSKLWSYNAADNASPDSQPTGLTIQNGVVCFSSYSAKMVYGLSASGGTLLWKYFAGDYGSVSNFILLGGTIYVQYADKTNVYLAALQLGDGKELWRVANASTYIPSYQVAMPGTTTTAVHYQVINGVIYLDSVDTGGHSIVYPMQNSDGSLITANT